MATLQSPMIMKYQNHAEDQEANVVAKYNNDAGRNNAAESCSWPTLLGFLFLTLNSVMAIVRSRGDMTAIAFVIFSYADPVALFVCLMLYERAGAGSSRREWLKIAVWLLTTLLTLAFSYKVAAVMPTPVAVLVWLMAFATIAGGFVAFFIYKEKSDDEAKIPCKKNVCGGDSGCHQKC